MFASEIQQALAGLTPKNAPTMRRLRRAWSRRLAHEPAAAVIGLATELSQLGDWERVFGYELVAYHRAAQRALRARGLLALGRGAASWGAVDCFAGYISGPAWREGQVPDQLIHRWARSPDRWKRRAALVSTVPLNARAHGGRGDPTRTLAVCKLLAHDRDDMVVKALSWALRELAKRAPEAVEGFLRAHAGHLAARVRREVRNKLDTGLKNPGQRIRKLGAQGLSKNEGRKPESTTGPGS
jgi:3-methyladenine DNA glycosylase AlkD